MEKGRDTFKPTPGYDVTVFYRCLSDSNDVSGRDVTYSFGAPSVHDVPEFIDLAIGRMNTAQRCRIDVFQPGTDENANPEPTVYEVRLNHFEKVTFLIHALTIVASTNFSFD